MRIYDNQSKLVWVSCLKIKGIKFNWKDYEYDQKILEASRLIYIHFIDFKIGT
jgi:hypothetical protein